MMFVPSIYLDAAFDVDGKVWGCDRCQVAWLVPPMPERCWNCGQRGLNLMWVNVPYELELARSRRR